MSLRNGMWHGLRNDIIMRNVKYGKWRKEINITEKHVRVFAAPFLGANLSEQLLCWSIYYCWLKPKGGAESSDKLHCIRLYAILN